MSKHRKQPTDRILYFDCFSGLSGDMTLGAFIDLGLEPEKLWEGLQQLKLSGYTAHCHKVAKHHLSGTKVSFQITESQPHRTYQDIVGLIAKAALSQEVKELSLRMFQLLAQAEAQVHQQPLTQVHFHEIGAVDSILDLVGTAFAYHALGITQVYASALPCGQGLVRCAHGLLPNPAPATVLLLEGAPMYGVDIRAELVTPTGAAILKGLNANFQPLPPIVLEKVGYGAGDRDLATQPNLLRLMQGRLAAAAASSERVLVLETHLDDMIPEWYEHLMATLFRLGALDVAYTPLQMKKNRPGVGLTVIAPLETRQVMLETLFDESTTLGVRVSEIERVTVKRWLETIDTPYGPLRVKVADIGGRRRLLPEYEACRELARQHHLPLLEVYRLIPM
ncbi:MAG TPA: nickel pincer cofactor biosynthesis protein LarC [Desulfobacterales bacterium]|nr:nickel pincer cofactor biosynthesis protein LarC [Desulfobacterales bacterium]